MKKNNKGFFLAETIVVLALVTTAMAFVYPNVSKLYDNYNSRIKYYDQTQDILLLKEIYNAYKDKIEDQTKGDCGDLEGFVGSKKFESGKMENIDINASGVIKDVFGLTSLYLTGYMTNVSDDSNYNFNKYLKRMRKVTNDTHAYRLIGVFSDGTNERYASIKITTDTFCGVN